MAREEELGKLVVDIDADSSGLKRGLSTAKSALARGIGSMKGVLRSLTVSLMAAGAIGVAALTKMSLNFLNQQKRLAILQNTYKAFSKNASKSFKDIEKGMFSLARTTGVSVADQTEALQVLLMTLNGLADPDYIQETLLPLAIDWAFVTGKSPADAAKDIAEAFLGEAPEELLMPVKAKFELENPGKEWDSLTKSEQWNLILDYLQQFAGSAEAASKTIWGAFARIKTAIEEVFNAMVGSLEFQPFMDAINGISDSLFDLAESIKDGNAPDWLKALTDALQRLLDKIVEFATVVDKDGKTGLSKFIDNLPKIAAGLVALTTIGPLETIIRGVSGALGGLFNIIAAMIATKNVDFAVTVLEKLRGVFATLTTSGSKVKGVLGALLTPFAHFFSALADGNGIMAAFAAFFRGFAPMFEVAATMLGTSVTALVGWLAVITASIVGFIAAWKGNWGDLRDRTKEVFSDIADIFKKIWTDSIKPIIDSLLDMWETGYNTLKDMLAKFDIILPDFENLFVSLKDVVTFILKGLADNIGNIFAFIIETIGAAVKMVASVLGAIIEAISFFVDTVVAIGKTIIALFTGNFDEIDDIWKDWGKKTWQNIKDILGYFGDFLKAIGQWFTDLIASIGRGIGSIFGKADEFYKGIKQWFSNLIGGFGNWGSSIVGKLSDMKDGFGTKLAAAKDFLFGFGKDTSDKNNEIYSNTKNWTSNMGTKFKGFASNVGSTLKDAFGFGEAYAADMDSMYGDNERETGTWKSNMATKYAEFATVVSNKLNDAKESIKTKFGNIKDSFIEHKGILAGKVSEVLNEYETLKTNIKTKIEAVRSTMSTNLSVIASDVKIKFNEVITNVKSFGTNFYNSGAELFNKLKEGLSSKFSSILQSIGGFIQDAVDVVKDWYNDFKIAGKGLIDAFWDGAIEKWKAFKKWLDDKLQVVRDFLPGSDAKEGPLSTLTKAGKGLFSAMEDGMKKEFPSFLGMVKDAASQTAMNIPNSKDLAFQGVANQAATTGSTVVLNITDSYFTSDRAKRELIDMIDEGLGNKRK